MHGETMLEGVPGLADGAAASDRELLSLSFREDGGSFLRRSLTARNDSEEPTGGTDGIRWRRDWQRCLRIFDVPVLWGRNRYTLWHFEQATCSAMRLLSWSRIYKIE